MSRGITEKDVWQAADALLLEGARPTIERVRQKIGRGSPNTVSPYLDAWFGRLGARLQDPGAFSAPSALPDPVHQAAQHFWEAALTSARGQLESDYRSRYAALEAEQEQLARERAQLQAEAERLAARQQGLEAALDATRSQLEEAARQRQRLEQQATAQQSELAAQRAEAAASRELAQQLASQLDGQRLAHEAERQRLEERAAAHERRWALELDRTRDALKQLQARAGAAEAEAARRIAQLEGARERLDGELREALAASVQLGHEADTWRLQYEQARQAAVEAKSSAEDQAAARQRLQVQLDETQAQLRAREQEHVAVLRSLAAVGARKARVGKAPPGKDRAEES